MTRRPASIIWPRCTRTWASTRKLNRSTRKRFGSGRRFLGQNIPTRRQALDNLGDLYRAMGKYAKAEQLLQEALQIRRKVLGPENPGTATSLNSLALLYQAMHAYAK